jgi:hypothetical protein
MRTILLLLLAVAAFAQAAEPDHAKKDTPAASAKVDKRTMPPEMKACVQAWADWEAIMADYQKRNPKGGTMSEEDGNRSSTATERIKAAQKAVLAAYFATADLTPVPLPNDRESRTGKVECARINELNQAMGGVAACRSHPEAVGLPALQKACAAYAKHYDIPELMDAMNQGPLSEKRHTAQGRGPKAKPIAKPRR